MISQTSTANNQIEGKPNLTASYPDDSCCLEKQTDSGEEQSYAAPPHNVEKREASARRYEPALGIHPQGDRKTRHQKQFDWVPDGPWLVDGKLDHNFVGWLAQSWQKQYGYNEHLARANVLRHFRKDVANIVIAWSQYRSEQHHRYSNAATPMRR